MSTRPSEHESASQSAVADPRSGSNPLGLPELGVLASILELYRAARTLPAKSFAERLFVWLKNEIDFESGVAVPHVT